MSQHYSDPRRERNPYALPNIETFQADYAECPHCSTSVSFGDGEGRTHCNECHHDVSRADVTTSTGWFYWYCFPGCLPDSDPIGPFDTEDAALADTRENADED